LKSRTPAASALGIEVSERQGQPSASYGKFRQGELFLVDAHISPYEQKITNLSDRKLLLHKRELKKLMGKVAERGFSLVPLKLY
jgi:SsrA-binding protein